MRRFYHGFQKGLTLQNISNSRYGLYTDNGTILYFLTLSVVMEATVSDRALITITDLSSIWHSLALPSRQNK